jgi:hypothetical protein
MGLNSEKYIRKVVGQAKPQRPLQAAFELRKMLLDLLGYNPVPDDEHVRKTVGRSEPQRKRS